MIRDFFDWLTVKLIPGAICLCLILLKIKCGFLENNNNNNKNAQKRFSLELVN